MSIYIQFELFLISIGRHCSYSFRYIVNLIKIIKLNSTENALNLDHIQFYYLLSAYVNVDIVYFQKINYSNGLIYNFDTHGCSK